MLHRQPPVRAVPWLLCRSHMTNNLVDLSIREKERTKGINRRKEADTKTPTCGAPWETGLTMVVCLAFSGDGWKHETGGIVGWKETYWLRTSPSRRRKTALSEPTSKDIGRFSSCFGPQSAPTETRIDVAQSIQSCTVFVQAKAPPLTTSRNSSISEVHTGYAPAITGRSVTDGQNDATVFPERGRKP